MAAVPTEADSAPRSHGIWPDDRFADDAGPGPVRFSYGFPGHVETETSS